ncbi:RNI-like protein [Meira miltonrushii]|uniref:RNI-like protein n=1 Tax=Meira miltonrushii TaxID=1280837 RepID=A0A316VJG8_9BASI|nr:RNI-like protein [Meira miltonrushii]PWN37696.1 RNI-like protein [Meira miltonrushii]
MASTQHIYSLVGKNLKLTSEEDIASYLEEIKAIENLQEIHLGGNTLGVGACQALGKVLKEKKTLRVADFADIFTGRLITEIPDALRALCDSLVDHESLVEMNLSDNAFGGRSAEPMVNFLTNNHHFSVLKLNNNGLGVTGGKIVADALLAAGEELVKQNKPSKLTTVICGRNRLEDGSAPHWAKAFASHKTLEEVRMFQNGIRMDGIVAIAQGLASCKQLKVLDLQDNTATVSGSRGIAAALPHWQDLETLNLSDCLLKPKGGYLILDVLHKGSNKKLNTLQLQYCDLDRKALGHLASAIDSGALANIEKLEINGNWADEDDECITKIKSALEKHGHEDALDELDEMDPEGEDEDEDEGAEEDEDDEEKKPEASEIAAAAVAAPAATAAVIGGAAVNAASGTKVTVEQQMQNLSVKEEKADASKNSTAPSEVAAAAVAAPAATAAVIGGAASNAVGNTKDAVKDATSKSNEEEKAQTIAEVEEAEKVVKDTDADAETSKQPPPLLGETDKTTLAGSVPQKPATEAPQEDSKDTLAVVGGGAALAGLAGAAVAGVTGQEDSAKGKSKAVERTEKADDTPAEVVKPAETAAEVAESAQEVPEEKEAAKVAAEVAESAQEVPDHKAAAETADEVAEVAKQVPEKRSGQATPVVAQQVEPNAALPAAPISGHGKQSSVDLSGELYGNQDASKASSSAPTTSNQDESKPKRKSGFRAAFGAIRELLK